MTTKPQKIGETGRITDVERIDRLRILAQAYTRQEVRYYEWGNS